MVTPSNSCQAPAGTGGVNDFSYLDIGLVKQDYTSLESLLTDVYNGVGAQKIKGYAKSEFGDLELQANNTWLKREENADREIRKQYPSLVGKVDEYDINGISHLIDQYIAQIVGRKNKIKDVVQVLRKMVETRRYVEALKATTQDN